LNAHTNAIQSGLLVFEQNAKKHLGLVTIISAILGVLFPAVGSLLLPFVMPMLFILMVFATLKIDLDRLIRAIKRPGLLITGICILYIVVPLTMYTLAILANLTADITLGVLFAALAPPIISAPIFVAMIEGDSERKRI
jgi:predicted Na+-dependent transporter